MAARRLAALAATAALLVAAARAAVFAGDFDGHYELLTVDTSQPGGSPSRYTGALFKHHDPNGLFVTVYDGTSTNGLCETTVVRDPNDRNRVVAVNPPAQESCVTMPQNAGVVAWTLAYLPHCSSVLAVPTLAFDGGSPTQGLIVQVDPATHTVVRNTPFSEVVSAPYPLSVALLVVPDHWPGAGRMKAFGSRSSPDSFENVMWEVPYTLDADGYAVIGQASVVSTFSNSFQSSDGLFAVYIDAGSPGFPNNALLVGSIDSPYQTIVYDVDALGNPILASGRPFISDLQTSVQFLPGAAQDLKTGDILIMQYGSPSGLLVRGTSPPTPVCCQTFQFQTGGCGREGGITVAGATPCNTPETGPCASVCCGAADECVCEVFEAAAPCDEVTVQSETSCVTLSVPTLVDRAPCSTQRLADAPCPNSVAAEKRRR